MELPIVIGERRVGMLQLQREGRFWRARARLTNQNRVLRLYIYGRGEPLYLGIPEPREGEMVLEKQLRSLPPEPEYCAERGAVPRRAPTESRAADKTAEAAPLPAPPARRRVWLGGKAYYF